MKKILITGGSGFIGSKLINHLSESDYSIRMLSRNPNPSNETVCCDLGQDKIPNSVFNSVDTVFHLAGYAHDLNNSIHSEYLYRAINVDATIDLAELAVDNGVERFVYVSSVKAGGPSASGDCMAEKDQKEPEGIYGKTKREAEIKLLDIGHHSGMHVSIVRPALVYGPGVKGNLQLMQSGIKNGWFPPLPEVNNRRSMVHVDDVVQALILVANDYRAKGEIFIATDGQPYSSRQIYEASCYLMGKTLPQWSVPKLIFDIASSLNKKLSYKVEKLLGNECYSSKKLQMLGFKAQHSLGEIR